jgi:hypothetical protein
MSSSVPSVEDRLRLALATADTLHRLASFVDEPHEIDLFRDLRNFAKAADSFAQALTLHIEAVKAALPASCQRVEAATIVGDER